MSRVIVSLLLGYALGVKFGYKPCYYFLYYIPGSLNPMIEKSNKSFDDGYDGGRNYRNAIYYCILKQKMDE